MASGYRSSSTMGDNKYWITGKDIHKKIITSMLQDFLGPEATVRSYTNNGEDGFLISTPGDCLTDDQIDEICRQSKHLWERQAADRRPSVGGPTTGLKRPLHKPVVISRARPRSSSGNNNSSSSIANSQSSSSSRRSFGHRGSFHSSPFQPPQQRSRHPYSQQPPPRPYSAMNHYDQYQPPPPPPPPAPSSHYAQQSAYSSYDMSRDAGDDRYSPYHQSSHRRGQRSFSGSGSISSPLSPLSNSQCDYSYDTPWEELPTPIGPPSSAQSSERRESIQS